MKNWITVLSILFVGLALVAHADDNPWLKAKVGDWVKYESVAAGTKTQIKWSVTAKTATSVTYAIETMVAGQTIKSSATADLKAVAAAPAANAAKPMMADETITVAGKAWKCKKVEVTASGMKTVSWVSADLPMGGLIKSETTGPVSSSMTLVDWGPK